MKKFLIGLLSAAAVMGTAALADTIEVTIDSSEVYTMTDSAVDKSTLEAAAYIENDITMVPLRFVSERLGAEVSWDEGTRTITCSKDGRKLVLTIGDTTAYVGDEAKILNAPPVIVNDITLVPLRFIAEGFDAYVEYVEPTRQVLISNDEPAVTVNGIRLDKGMFKAFYQLNILYAQYYGEELYKDLVYNQLANLAALSSQWSLIDPSNTLPEEALAQLASFDETQMAEAGFLKAYLAKIYELQNTAEKASSMLSKSFDDTAVQDEYDKNYTCAKHILIMTTDEETGEAFDEAGKKKAKKTAEDLLAKIKKGGDFDALMAEYSQDPGSKAQPDGYIFTYGEMVKEFEDAAFALEENAVSDIVETNYGYHIIKRLPLPEMTEAIKTNISEYLTNSLLSSMTSGAQIVNVTDKQALYDYMSAAPEANKE